MEERNAAPHRSPLPADRRSFHWEETLDRAFVPSVVLLVSAYLSVVSPVFLTSGNIQNVLSQAVVLALVAFGATFVIIAREMDLSVGAGTAFVSVMSAYAMVLVGSVPLGIIVGVASGLAVGIVNGLLVTGLRIPSFIATLAMLVILRGVALALTSGGVIAGLPSDLSALSTARLAGLPLIVWLMVIVFAALYALQSQTTFGLRVFAVGGNPEAARLTGIPVDRIRFLCFALSGVTMGLSGLALMIRVESGQPNGGQLLELYAVAAIVMGGTTLAGGRGSVARTLSGVMLVVILQNGLNLMSVTFDIQQAIIGLVFIMAASIDFLRNQLRRRAELLLVRRTTS